MKDSNTRKLDDIVRGTKAKKDIGAWYMKSWEREKEIREEGRSEERANTEIERRRADEAERELAKEREHSAALERRLAELEAVNAAD